MQTHRGGDLYITAISGSTEDRRSRASEGALEARTRYSANSTTSAYSIEIWPRQLESRR
jgi:hypothetical protein